MRAWRRFYLTLERLVSEFRHEHVTDSTVRLRIGEVDNEILQIDLGLLHRKKLLEGPKAHLDHDDYQLFETLGSCYFNPRLFA